MQVINGYQVFDYRKVPTGSAHANPTAADLLATEAWFLPQDDGDDLISVQEAYPDNEQITDGENTVTELAIGDAWLYVHESPYGSTITIYDSAQSWTEYFRGCWDYGDRSLEELMADFGLHADEALPTVDEDHEGPVRIWRQWNYYVGSLGRPRDGYVHDDESRDTLTWDSYAEAQAWIDGQESEPYILASGEAGRPEYTICEA